MLMSSVYVCLSFIISDLENNQTLKHARLEALEYCFPHWLVVVLFKGNDVYKRVSLFNIFIGVLATLYKQP